MDEPAVVVVDGRWAVPLAGPSDVGLVDLLARLQLEARRRGRTISLRHPCPELCGLLELVGLGGLLPVEAGGEAEVGEALGVEEVVPPGDPAP